MKFSRFIRRLIVLLVLLAAALFVVSYLGILGSSWQNEASTAASSVTELFTSKQAQPVYAEQSGTEQADPQQSAPEAPSAESTENRITVSESTIVFNGQAVTADDLRQRLMTEVESGQSVILSDEQAIKAEYDTVRGLLTELGIPFTEE